ncbi:unnamed protein product [Symbiodinium natans]|uniref:Pseudouridine synthase RsuA/RluA-like domain-containing protein n=1 Tax=Symbiodinium natans TaxID=878477 RepID=A0A812PGV5_9DINO|nr:unnamed protein product [Symbiodinium natans]
MAKVAYSFAVLGHATDEPRLFRALAAESTRRIALVGAQDLANMMQALVWCKAAEAISASSEVQRFLVVASRRCVELCKCAIPKDLCCFAWSFASLGKHYDIVLPAVAEASVHRIPDFNPRFLCGQLAWAFAAKGISNGPLFGAIADAASDEKCWYAPRDISNLAWSFAMLGRRHFSLFDSLCGRALHALEQFNSQDLANMLWAYSHLGIRAPVLFSAAEARVKETMCGHSLQELSSIAWAYDAADMMSSQLFEAIEHEFARRLRLGPGKEAAAQRARDVKALLRQLRSAGPVRRETEKRAEAELRQLGNIQDVVLPVEHPSERGFSVGSEEMPRVVLDLSDRSVFYKPPGWEVQSPDSLGHHQLSAFVRWTVPQRCPIVYDVQSSHGFLHRLDVSTSGLVLHAKSYAAYHDLDLQLLRRELDREYLVLVHGLVPPARTTLDLPVYVEKDSESRPSQVAVPGARRSLSHLKVLAHLGLRQSCSLLAMKIDTGRRHQIRAQTAHVGHPVACDWLYTTTTTHSADKEWCGRTFLHRNRLAFKDKNGKRHDVTHVMPADLRQALATCAAKDAVSHLAVNALTTRSFAEYVVLSRDVGGTQKKFTLTS